MKKYLKIVSACYSFYRSSYIISFSSSLCNSKLTFVELRNGTCRILSDKGHLIVVIRASTRHYDDPFRQNNQRYGSRFFDPNLIATTDFRKTFCLSPVLFRFDDPNLPRYRNLLVRRARAKGTLDYRKVVDDITNQLKSNSRVSFGKSISEMSPTLRERKIVIKKSTVSTTTNCAVKSKSPISMKRPRSTKKIPLLPEVPKNCQHCNAHYSDEYLCTEHEDICMKILPNGKDIRDIAERKTFFASVLGLVPTQTVHPEEIKIENKIDKVLRSRTPIPIPIVAEPVVPEFKAPLPPTTRPRNLRSVPSRNKSSKFFKDHPFLAITSTKGQECLEKFGERKPPPLISNAPAHEKDCRSEITTEPYCTPKIVTPKKRRLKDNQYLHYYSLGATDRLLRNTELIVGLSLETQKKLDRCTPLSVAITRIASKVVKDIQERDKKRRLAREEAVRKANKEKLKGRFIKVELKDFMIYPEDIREYVEKNSIMIKYGQRN
ncbi:uncharacterized protein LOC110851108 [Folsomia candida]|uniref:uncharacterized protein LOC110851108 n=1 Tax=Folsomia candida TaxID=158441 RepID=UPI0016055AF2|nr:uncharacterized protein LOC110851108 [Folsomia candida]